MFNEMLDRGILESLDLLELLTFSGLAFRFSSLQTG
jgi:hypothetical protein